MKNNPIINQIVSIYEVLGGIIGVGLLVYLVSNIIPQLSGQNITMPKVAILLLIVIYALGAYVLSILAGIFLWKGSKRGFVLSIISQGMQIPQFAILGLSYMFVSGVEFTVLTNMKSITSKAYIGSTFNITYNSGDIGFFIGLNLVAIAFFLYLLLAYRKSPKKKS